MKYKISSEYDKGLRKRKLFSKLCKVCKKEFWIPKHVLLKSFYCSRKCCNSDTNSLKIKCSLCEKLVLKRPSEIKASKSGLLFCSRKCKDDGQQIDNGFNDLWPKHYNNEGKTTYRKRAFHKYGKKCMNIKCGYDEEIRMLDVHHKDFSRSNNKIDNLEVLCVWCHALKTRQSIIQA
jgi:hypothetical protein